MKQNRQRKIIGITGGVGAGKSAVLSYLGSRYGARILQADEIGRLLQAPGEPCYEQIKGTFGEGILREDGTIDREKLGGIVYADRARLSELNAIVHPAVKARIRQEIASEKTAPLFVIEAALLLEDHYEEICEEIWYIYAAESVRAARLASSRGYSAEKIRQIMDNQLSDQEFRSRCSRVIDNSGTFDRTGEQIDALMHAEE